jgi:putative tricarboxylic transport membrane protein
MPDPAYAFWTDALRRLQADPRFAEARAGAGLFEFNMVGAGFEALAKRRTAEYRALAREVGLVQQSQ